MLERKRSQKGMQGKLSVKIYPGEPYIKKAKLVVIHIFDCVMQFCSMGHVLNEKFPNMIWLKFFFYYFAST